MIFPLNGYFMRQLSSILLIRSCQSRMRSQAYVWLFNIALNKVRYSRVLFSVVYLMPSIRPGTNQMLNRYLLNEQFKNLNSTSSRVNIGYITCFYFQESSLNESVKKLDHITPLLKTLQWLFHRLRVTAKVLMKVKSPHHFNTCYLLDLVFDWGNAHSLSSRLLLAAPQT